MRGDIFTNLFRCTKKYAYTIIAAGDTMFPNLGEEEKGRRRREGEKEGHRRFYLTTIFKNFEFFSVKRRIRTNANVVLDDGRSFRILF